MTSSKLHFSRVASVSRLHGERQTRIDSASKIIKFEIPFLDDITRGIAPHDLVLFGGPTGAGKTELARMIAQSAAAAGHATYFFALEAEDREIERRIKYAHIAAHIAAPAKWRLNYADWVLGLQDDLSGPYEDAADAEFVARYSQLHTFYRVASDFTGETLRRQLHDVRNKAKLIVVDHLHYIDADDDQGENQSLRSIVKILRDSALTMGVPIFVLAHLRKRDRNRKMLIADEDEFLGSSAIGQIATKVITLAPAFDQDAPSNTTDDRFRSTTLYPTYMRVCKDRKIGKTQFVALLNFSKRTNTYESKYRLGRINYDGDTWTPMTSGLPAWAGEMAHRA